MTAQPGVRFGIANAVLVSAFLVASLVRLDSTEIAWSAVLSVSMLGVGLSLSMTSYLAVIAWAWFTGFVENRFGELTFAADDLRRLAVFVTTAVALAAFAHVVQRQVREKAHG